MTSWDWIKLAIAILALIVSVSTLVFVIRNNKRLFGRYWPPGGKLIKRDRG